MKKYVFLALTLVLVLGLTACAGKAAETKPAGENTEDEPLCGGWEDTEDGAVTQELRAIFDKAMAQEESADFEPVQLLGTQVVAGTNYRFLCNAEDTQMIVTVYEDLEGNCTVTDVTDAEN